MNCDYEDIRSRIAEPPKWWDEQAVPRYCEFEPKEVADIYAKEIILLQIACQGCGKTFRVAMSYGTINMVYKQVSFEQHIKDGTIHYGDPPNVDCCPAGPTMNCEDLRVLQYWRWVENAWRRVAALEVELPDLADYVKRWGSGG